MASFPRPENKQSQYNYDVFLSFREVAKALECKDTNEGSVIPIFYKVNPSDVRKLRGNFGRDFAKIEETYTRDKGDVKRWKDALRKVADLAGRELKDGYETKFIQQIIGEIENKLGPRLSYVVGNLVGMHSRVADVVEHLCLGESDVRSIGIWGMGGIGNNRCTSIFLANVREISEKSGLIYLQNEFLGDILHEDNLRIRDDHRGANMIKERLRHKKVLLVLDDVDEKEQLEKLAGDLDWFGHGSRIIITTRDRHLLLQYGVNAIYKAEKLSIDEALELFCLKSFRSKHPPADFMVLVKQVIKYTDGLPLALDVLGSFLANRSLMQWNSALARLKQCPERKIIDLLRLSYDGLTQVEKEIFLDIACFFKGKEKTYVTEVLDNCGFYPAIGMEVLVERSLIEIRDNKLWMHDLLQEMAWEIVRQESPEEPGERSRIWLFEDVCHILSKNSSCTDILRVVYQGTGKVKGIVLQSGDWRTVCLNGESFTNMTNLRLLDIRAIHLSSGVKHLSNELRLLIWDNCNLKSFPPGFIPKNLLELNMWDCLLSRLWRGEKVLEKLKVIDLNGSKLFVETPNFINVPNLERLILKGCKALSQVHPSIGMLKRLSVLDLGDCENLASLPDCVEIPDTYVVFPCLEGEIPEWFSYQTVGPLLSIDMSPNWFNKNWKGFAICASFEQTNCNSCQDPENAPFIFCDFYVDGNRLVPTVEFPIRFVNSGCLWLGFVPRWLWVTNWRGSNCIDVSLRITNPVLKGGQYDLRTFLSAYSLEQVSKMHEVGVRCGFWNYLVEPENPGGHTFAAFMFCLGGRLIFSELPSHRDIVERFGPVDVITRSIGLSMWGSPRQCINDLRLWHYPKGNWSQGRQSRGPSKTHSHAHPNQSEAASSSCGGSLRRRGIWVAVFDLWASVNVRGEIAQAWEEVQRHSQDLADHLAQGFMGLIQCHMTPPSFSWLNPRASQALRPGDTARAELHDGRLQVVLCFGCMTCRTWRCQQHIHPFSSSLISLD
ncbi:hypothetical protein NL676_024004 [Syzygium grande]|nr:hypothetical protein NL676_024004 [Syzygium grande]